MPKRSVLIVDRSEENREVLSTALARRGVTALTSCRAPQAVALAREHHPDLIVVDLEVTGGSEEDVFAAFSDETNLDGTPMVVLGSARVAKHAEKEGEFVAKPYHYGPLLHKIEQMLQADR